MSEKEEVDSIRNMEIDAVRLFRHSIIGVDEGKDGGSFVSMPYRDYAALKQERDRYKAALEKGLRFIQEHYCAEMPERLEIIREFREALTPPSAVKS